MGKPTAFFLGIIRTRTARFFSLFSTIQTLSLDRILKDFAPDAFDFIIIDEAHRSGANSYDKIMAHFQPEFWLGMTATPKSARTTKTSLRSSTIKSHTKSAWRMLWTTTFSARSITTSSAISWLMMWNKRTSQTLPIWLLTNVLNMFS